MPEPQGEVTAAFVGRLLDDKGVRTLIAAHERLAGQGRGVKLLIAGDRDEANPASIPQDEMQCWAQIPDIEMLGHVADIRDVWRRAHIAVLPSRREGLPKSLLDAAACGRAMVATDVPGCREIARAGLNAILVPPDDAAALANAIAQLAADPQLRQDFGAAGRRLVETEFSSAQIGAQTVSLYNRLLGRAS
jgi:glycosyltransferase involved in cell wall biosynthesis